MVYPSQLVVLLVIIAESKTRHTIRSGMEGLDYMSLKVFYPLTKVINGLQIPKSSSLRTVELMVTAKKLLVTSGTLLMNQTI